MSDNQWVVVHIYPERFQGLSPTLLRMGNEPIITSEVEAKRHAALMTDQWGDAGHQYLPMPENEANLYLHGQYPQ